MNLLSIAMTLIVVGILLWVVNTYIPMAEGVKSLLNGVVIIILVVWLLKMFGIIYYAQIHF